MRTSSIPPLRIALLSLACLCPLAARADSPAPALVIAAAAPSRPSAAAPLQVSRGTMEAGGFVGITVVNSSGTGFGATPTTGVTLSVSPTFGVFVAKRLELSIATGISAQFGSLYTQERTVYSFQPSLTGRYLFAFGSRFIPYAGLRFGASIGKISSPYFSSMYTIPGIPGFTGFESLGNTQVSLSAGIPLGLLVAINHHVALDLGTAVNLSFGLTSQVPSFEVSVPIGYMGMAAFF